MGAGRPELLVVEEDAAVRRVIVRLLVERDVAVWQAVSGLDAVDVYARHHPTIDAVLLDVGMNGLDGPATLLELQRVNPHVRCYFMTGGGGRHDDASLQTLCGAPVVRKPFQIAELARMLGQVERNLIQAAGLASGVVRRRCDTPEGSRAPHSGADDARDVAVPIVQ